MFLVIFFGKRLHFDTLFSLLDAVLLVNWYIAERNC